jgi:ABC-type multidrug transport system fused ATPase/permease subunit
MNKTNFLRENILNHLAELWLWLSKRRKLQFCFLLFLMILVSSFEILSIGAVVPFLAVLTSPDLMYKNQLTKPLIELMNIDAPDQLVAPLVLSFIFLIILASTMRLLMLWASSRLSLAIGADLSMEVYRRTLYQPYYVHISRNTSEVIDGVSGKVNGVIYSVLSPVLTLLSSIFIVFAITAAFISFYPVMSLLVFSFFSFIYFVISILTRKRLADNSQKIASGSTEVIKSLQEGLGGIRDILLDGSQEVFCKLFSNIDKPLRLAQANNLFIANSPRYIVEAFGILLIIGLALFFYRTNGLISALPILGALALGAQRLLPALQLAYQSWSNILGGQASLVDVLKLLSQPVIDRKLLVAGTSLAFKEAIVFDSVSYQYTPQSPMVLNNISLSIKRGSRVGIMGVTGSGKSTITDLMMGLLDPTDGKIFVDNQILTLDNLRAWQNCISHVPQTIFLSDATILENIAFGAPRSLIDFDRAVFSAKQAKIDLVIEALPLKYDSFVGEGGVKLSGGQRQRLGIARALYKQAKLIVLDEATSALDDDTEKEVMRSIEAIDEDITVVIIAHRLSTLKSCSVVIKIDKGAVVKLGSYEEVCEKS